MPATPSPFLSNQAAEREARDAAWLVLLLVRRVVVGDQLRPDQLALQPDHAPAQVRMQVVQSQDMLDDREESSGVTSDVLAIGCAGWRTAMCEPYAAPVSFSSCIWIRPRAWRGEPPAGRINRLAGRLAELVDAHV